MLPGNCSEQSTLALETVLTAALVGGGAVAIGRQRAPAQVLAGSEPHRPTRAFSDALDADGDAKPKAPLLKAHSKKAKQNASAASVSLKATHPSVFWLRFSPPQRQVATTVQARRLPRRGRTLHSTLKCIPVLLPRGVSSLPLLTSTPFVLLVARTRLRPLNPA
ncbi:hypothetical protein B0H14DRAFT_3862576 [Mycena olivaceomarginata]|nr:hypothetical protein B0H14DRAFT_3862576 [Mycena olivaceomarginata]